MELKLMNITDFINTLKTFTTEQLLNVFDWFAREDCGSYRYCEVRAEIYRRLEEAK